jgi:hypothetical protein
MVINYSKWAISLPYIFVVISLIALEYFIITVNSQYVISYGLEISIILLMIFLIITYYFYYFNNIRVW